MRTVSFPDWESVLGEDPALRDADRRSYTITIRWFLSYCRRQRSPADFACARRFMAEAEARKQPSGWVLGRWKNAINWFFRHAPREVAPEGRGAEPPEKTDRTGDGEEETEAGGAPRGPEGGPARLEVSAPGWKLRAIRGVRIRQFSYRTEKSYLNWLERFARYWNTSDLEALGENEIKLYLDHLAVRERVSGGTQRLALNALVFFYRDALKRALGDFSDYRKASSTKRIPVVLSVEEIRRLLAELAPAHGLMARFTPPTSPFAVGGLLASPAAAGFTASPPASTLFTGLNCLWGLQTPCGLHASLCTLRRCRSAIPARSRKASGVGSASKGSNPSNDLADPAAAGQHSVPP